MSSTYKGCRKCIKGWIIDEITEEAIKCSCLEKTQKQIESEAILKRANLPVSIKDYDLSKYIGEDKNKNIEKLVKYIEQFKEKYHDKHLYVYGKNSCQKTTVLSFIVKELIREGYEGYYVMMNDLVKLLTSEGFKESAEDEIKKYLNCDILLIDESYDLSKMTVYSSGYQVSFLDNFIRKRFSSGKATIFISNVKVEDIDNKFGQSLKILINRTCAVLEFTDSINLINNFNTNDLWN